MKTTTFIPTESQMVENLRAVRAAASAEQVREGREWYPAAGRLVRELAAECRILKSDCIDDFLTVADVAAIISAYSQNQGWKGNITIARRFLSGDASGMKSVLAECERILDGEDPATVLLGKGGQSKRPDFWRNILGRHTYVTCDRWHKRAAGCIGDPNLTPALREMITRATRRVAREYGESASACQAVCWCVMRGTGQ